MAVDEREIYSTGRGRTPPVARPAHHMTYALSTHLPACIPPPRERRTRNCPSWARISSCCRSCSPSLLSLPWRHWAPWVSQGEDAGSERQDCPNRLTHSSPSRSPCYHRCCHCCHCWSPRRCQRNPFGSFVSQNVSASRAWPLTSRPRQEMQCTRYRTERACSQFTGSLECTGLVPLERVNNLLVPIAVRRV